MSAPALVQKLWIYCNPAVAGRDDDLSYGDYVDQLTFLLFDSRFHCLGFAKTFGLPLSASLRLKMADEQSRQPYNKPSLVPKGFGWDKLVALDGDVFATFDHGINWDTSSTSRH